MNKCCLLALSMLAAIALNTAIPQVSNAQAKPPVYVVAEVDVSDNAGFVRDYLPQAQANIKANGGRFLVAGQKITSLEGTPPKRVIVTAWDSIEKIDEWFNSPEFKDLRKVGDKYAKFRLFTVEGVPQ